MTILICLKSKPFFESVLGKRIRCTLLPSVHSESSVGIGSYHASDLLLVFAAVKKMAPSSREAIGQEVPDESPCSAPSPRGAIGPEVPDACVLLGVSWSLPVCHE